MRRISFLLLLPLLLVSELSMAQALIVGPSPKTRTNLDLYDHPAAEQPVKQIPVGDAGFPLQATASQSGSPDSLLGWGIPDYSQALLLPTKINSPKSGSFTVYPNPVSDHLTIELPALISAKFEVAICDLQGRKIRTYHAEASGKKVIQVNELGFLSPGIYMVCITDESRSYTQKIIKLKK